MRRSIYSWRLSATAGLLLPGLLLCCGVYYLTFAANFAFYDGEAGLFQLALNAHDHGVYASLVESIRAEGVAYEFNNDVGISLVYVALSWLFPLSADPDFTLLALLFNSAVLCACYAVYAKICQQLGLGWVGRLSFFANLSLLYFAQLINKDLLTILAFLITVYCGMNRRLGWLLLMLPLFALVRQQLAVFGLLFIFLMGNPRPWTRIVLAYVVTSLAAGVLSVVASVIGKESLGDGFSSFLIDFNQQYYVGYLLFNPVRVLQYVADAYASFSFWTDADGIDTARLLRLPQLVLLLLLINPLLTIVTKFSWHLSTAARPLVLVVVAYLLAWLMNPTINARYVMLITPVLVLFALHARKQRVFSWR
jgi:hypothetical protein